MYEPKQRIQFFNSQSSFGSSSNLPESKYYDFTNELIAQTQNIFGALKKQLQPNERQGQGRIEYSLRRAQILQKDTIPQHIAYLSRIQAPKDAKRQVTNCKERLAKLLGDYEKLKNGTMIYKQFYNIYGKESSKASSSVSAKKEESIGLGSEAELVKQEYVEVSSIDDKSKLKGATPRAFIKPNNSNYDKELHSLREENFSLKKSIEENRKKYQLQIISQRLLFQKRIRTYLSIDLNFDEKQKSLKNEIKQYSQNISSLLQENLHLQQRIQELNKKIKALQFQNQITQPNDLLLQIGKIHEQLKRYDNSISQAKKGQKIIRNVLEENQLLLTQIKNQRKKYKQMQNNLSEEQRRQCERAKKHLQKKKAQLEQLYSHFDKQRIQIAQLNYNNRSHSKILQDLKKQNESLKQGSSKPFTKHEYPPPSILSFSIQQNISPKHVPKLLVCEYQGDGIEGYPYYEMLSKQFKIRFRRACLKQKQLIYKANGIEIGVITTFQSPNTIHMLVHLTNCSEDKLSKCKIKFMNTNQNIIDNQLYECATLSPNEQIKVPVSLTIYQYPIGPLILLLQFEADKKEQVRILLPAHLVKTMQIKSRQTKMDLLSCSRVVIVRQRKICKDINDLKQFFPIGKVTDQTIRLNVFHQHTQTLLELDMFETKEGIELMHRHLEGMRQISDYFIKTLAFLMKKEQVK